MFNYLNMKNGRMCFCKFRVILLMIFCMSIISCYVGKQGPLNQLEELTEDIRQHHEEYSTADWKEAYARYEQIASEMEKYQYTREEAEKIGKLEGECVGYFMKSAINSLDGLGKEVEGFFDGFKEAIE